MRSQQIWNADIVSTWLGSHKFVSEKKGNIINYTGIKKKRNRMRDEWIIKIALGFFKAGGRLSWIEESVWNVNSDC